MKRCLSLILVFALLLACTPAIPLQANAATVASGTCGDNISWTLDDAGTLTISGTGLMYNYSEGTTQPWYDYRSVIKNVIIKEGVTSIGTYAFFACYSLTSIEIAGSVTSIGHCVFMYCDSLTTIVLPDSVTAIPNGAFYACSSLTSIVIPDGVTSIGGSAFSNCSSLTSIEIPDSVTSIDYYAFQDCSSLTYNTYDNGKYLGNCTNPYATFVEPINKSIATCLIFPDVKSICALAFYGCKNLTNIKIPDSVTSIGGSAFSYCSSLTSIDIPDSVTSIDDSAFSYCSSLESVEIGDSVTAIGNSAFIACSNLESIIIPNSVVSIDDSAFYNCSNLKNVYYFGTETQRLLMVIGTGNIPLLIANWSYVKPAKCEYWENGRNTATQYGSLDEAMTAATNGTIKLLIDATADTVLLKPGVTLDLNGYTLTADSVIVFNGAAITDGGESCTGGGLLKVPEDNLGFMRENGQGVIPVWNGVDGYVFTKVTFQQMARVAGTGTAQYIFLPTFSNAEASALLADGGADNGLKLKVSLIWNDGQSQQLYTYKDSFVKDVFASNGKLAFSLTVTGIAGISDMTASAVIVTDTGAQATATGTQVVPGEENTEDGTLANPDEPVENYGFTSFSIDVDAGTKKLVHIVRSVNAATLCIYDKDAYVVYKGNTYTPSNGAIYIVMESEGSNTPLELEIGNSGSAAKTFDVTFSFPEGTRENPIALNAGKNKIVCAAGNEMGTYYTFKADTAGTLTLDVQGINPSTVVCGISINDMQAIPTVVELEEGRTTVSIALPAGAKAEIVFTTKDPDKEWKIPAAEITVNASFQ